MEDIIQKQRLTAQKVLDQLRLIDPAAILAGGAVRNWFMGKPAVDLDFYMFIDGNHLSHANTKALLERILDTDLAALGAIQPNVNVEAALGDEGIIKEGRIFALKPAPIPVVDEVYQGMNKLKWVFEGVVDGIKINIMLMKVSTYNQNDCVGAFGATISRFWSSNPIREERDIYLREAVLSACLKHVYLTNNIGKKYKDKITKYFPHFTFTELNGEVDPTELLLKEYEEKFGDNDIAWLGFTEENIKLAKRNMVRFMGN